LQHLRNVTFTAGDISAERPENQAYDAVFSIDVIEHLEPEFEKIFIENMMYGLKQNGVMIIGTPNESASQYATFRSDHQHINLKSAQTLKGLLDQYFDNSFILIRLILHLAFIVNHLFV
jgi:2-polyprenyl-3-methyl-5-hydroxy-6-metoxy-1,4-benzoquinol methylase